MKSKKRQQNSIVTNCTGRLLAALSIMQTLKTTLLFALGLGLSSLVGLASAKDLGVQAKVWEITEKDFREVILADMAKVNWEENNKQVTDSAKNYTADLPKRYLPEAEKTITTYIDPSIQLTSDIKIPVKGTDGKYSWQVYYKKGMTLNPLERLRPTTALFFFDGRSKEQVAFAKSITEDPFSSIVAIEASGENFDGVLKEFGRMVFYAFQPQIDRFQVTQLPALVYAGEGKYDKYLANTVFAKPYTRASVSAVWPKLKGEQKK